MRPTPCADAVFLANSRCRGDCTRGQCHYAILGAEVAREMIEAGEYEDVANKWAAEHKRRWEKSKFVKLWEKEKKAGRDPRKAFKDRGWEP